MIQIHPLIQPDMTVGEYLDTLGIHKFPKKGKVWDVTPFPPSLKPKPKPVTDSPDPKVEVFWSEVVRIYDNDEIPVSCTVCGKPCFDSNFRPYFICSDRCSNLAAIQEDESREEA